MSVKEKPALETWELILGVFAGIATTEAIVIVFFFTTFPTKEAVSTQFDLRSKARDIEISGLRNDITEIKGDIKILLQRVPEQ